MRSRLFIWMFLATSATATPANALTFTGEVVGTATSASFDVFWTYFDPGETWTFTYSYESDVIDGNFNQANSGLALYWPDGAMFTSLPACGSGSLPCQTGPFMTVNQSIVTSFQLQVWNVWTIMYNSGSGGWNYDHLGGGPVTITNPVAVPENTSTVVLFCAALMTLLRQYRRSPSA